MRIKFSKMHGSGNDFVIINSLVQNIRISATMARRIADRRLGIGCDQLLFIQPPLNAETDFDLNFYNHDGSEAEQCGNGARCAAHYVFKKKLTGNRQIKMQTKSSVVHLKLNDDKSVTADMGKPIFNPKKIPFIARKESMLYHIDVEGTILDISVLSMGNPHAVISVNNTDSAEVEKIGKILQKHARFPDRVNVNFMQVVNRKKIKLRVFERGVGETPACGTGACAAVVAGVQQQLIDSTVEVSLPGGTIEVEWFGGSNPVKVTGPVQHVYDGILNYEK